MSAALAVFSGFRPLQRQRVAFLDARQHSGVTGMAGCTTLAALGNRRYYSMLRLLDGFRRKAPGWRCNLQKILVLSILVSIVRLAS